MLSSQPYGLPEPEETEQTPKPILERNSKKNLSEVCVALLTIGIILTEAGCKGFFAPGKGHIIGRDASIITKLVYDVVPAAGCDIYGEEAVSLGDTVLWVCASWGSGLAFARVETAVAEGLR